MLAEIMKRLVGAKADLNAKQPDDMAALIHAAFGGKTEGARLLIQAGANVNARMTDGRTALD